MSNSGTTDESRGETVLRDTRYEAFTFAPYRNFWGARFLAAFSVQMMAVAVGWQIYDLTRDPLDLGLIGLSQFAPSVVLVLVTGAAADRYGRRSIMRLSVLLFLMVASGLLALTLQGLTSPLPVFALLVLLGVGRAFYGPAASSLVVSLVPTRVFPNAVAWNSSAWQVAMITGPVAGGLLYGLGAAIPYALAVLLLALAALLITRIPHVERKAEQGVAGETKAQQIFAGFRYIFSQPVVLGAISLDLFAVLLGGAVALLPVFARDVLDLGPWGLGLLRAAPGIGAVAMAAWIAAHPIRDHAGLIMFAGVALFGVFTLTFGFSTVAWLSIASLALLGAADMVSVQVRETLIQLWTPDHVRGRVNAVNSLFVGASNELGEMRAGTMAAFIGAVPAVVAGGAGAIAVAGLWAWMFPALRKIRRLDERVM
ncbi:MAG: MFS transporter [Rhizobiaceae bacterium]|nr:MFS transporter [Rhizobiaceae bacterium]